MNFDGSNFDGDDFRLITKYENELVGYYGKAKVKFSHTLFCDIVPTFRQSTEDYLKELKENLHDFGYSSMFEESKNNYKFRKSRNITENFEMNIEIQMLT